MNKTNFELLRELLQEYKPKTRGVLYQEEIKLIKDKLQLEGATEIELRNMRDFTVAAFFDDDCDRVSAITTVIDTVLFDKGYRV